jgi:hypothetical protein
MYPQEKYVLQYYHCSKQNEHQLSANDRRFVLFISAISSTAANKTLKTNNNF